MSVTMMHCIESEPEILARILNEYETTLAPVRQRLAQGPVRRLLILATGSSMNAAQCAAFAFSQWAGVQVEIKEPYPFTHYERLDEQADWIVALSQSGKSHSTLQAQRKAQAAGRQVWSLTSDPHSPLAREADALLDINCGIEPVGFVTVGFSATVLNLLLMAMMIGEPQGELGAARRESLLQSLRALTRYLPETMRRTDAFIDRHQTLLAQATRYVAIGYGWLAWRRSLRPSSLKPCVAPPAALSWKPICTAPIWRRTPAICCCLLKMRPTHAARRCATICVRTFGPR